MNNKATDDVNLFDAGNTALLDAEIAEFDKVTVLKLEVDKSLETAINELNALSKEYSRKDTDNLIELCKQSVLSTIVGQFGIASVLLEAKDGGSVTTTHNFEKGITATQEDRERYEDLQYVRSGGYKERRPLYDKRKNEIRAEVRNSGCETVVDGNTGRKIKFKDSDIDHIVSAKENETDARAHLHLSQEDRVRVGTDDSNFTFTSSSANRSKQDKSTEEWLKTKNAEGKTPEERGEAIPEKALRLNKSARRKRKKTINKAAFKKYSKELLATGGKDAAKMAAYSAIGVIMHDLSLAVVEELKYILKNRGEKSFKELFKHFKEKMVVTLQHLKEKWKDVLQGSLEAGIMAFLSNVLVFVINLFATTLKKLVSMIRAGFVSLCQAIKVMACPPEGMTQDEANYAATKVLTTGLIGALSLGLSAMIEKFLQSIPGLQPIMMFPIPSFGDEQRTVSDVLAVTLSALAGGLVTTVVLYFMDKFVAAGKQDKIQFQMVATSGVVMHCQIAKSWLAVEEAYDFLADEVRSVSKIDHEACLTISQSNADVAKGLKGWDAIKSRLD